MGKVLSDFKRGWPGAVSRSKDDVILSLKNGDQNAIAFGAPVFLKASSGSVVNFSSGTTTADQFVGFAVRVPDKTPDAYPSVLGAGVDSDRGKFNTGDPVDVLARGSIVAPIATTSAKIGDKVYIRLSDGKLVTTAGDSGTTLELPNVRIRGSRDSGGCCEVVVTKRNLV